MKIRLATFMSSALVLLFVVLALSGCAIPFPDSMYDWKRTHEPLPHTWHIVPQEAVQAYCAHSNSYVMSCAYWVTGDHCWIFTASQHNMEATRKHEERHCAGWNHA